MSIRNIESHPKPHPEVAVLGEALLRLATSPGSRLSDGGHLTPHVAGSEANVAAALAQLGVACRWTSRLPDSPLGARVMAELTRHGVDTATVSWAPAPSRLGIFYSEIGESPRPTEVLYDRANSTFAELEQLPPEAVGGARIAHLSGITPGLGEDSERLSREFTDLALSEGAILSVDVNHRRRLWSARKAADALRPLLGQAGIVTCSAADAAALFDIAGDPDDVVIALRDKVAPGARCIALTLGADGCAVLDHEGVIHREDAMPTTIVDRFGMGDAFVAGLLWGLLRDDVPAAVRAGTRLAAWKATLEGDFVRIDHGQFERLLADGEREILR